MYITEVLIWYHSTYYYTYTLQYLTIHIHIMLQNEVMEPQCFQSAMQRFLPRLYFRTPLCWSRMDFLELLSRGLMFEGSVANKIVKQPFTRVYLWKKDKLNLISQRSHDFSLKSLCAAWWCYSVRPWWSQATKCCNWYSDRCGLWTFWAVVGPLWKLKGLCWLEIQCLLRSWNPKNPLNEDVFARFDLKSYFSDQKHCCLDLFGGKKGAPFAPSVCGQEGLWFIGPVFKTYGPVSLRMMAVNICKQQISGWPLVGNEGINLYIGILGIHSLIPY